jgi:predicted TIM-barrel fold metal-dependent hydrolase
VANSYRGDQRVDSVPGAEDPEQILERMNACAVEKAFLFTPELDIATRRLTNDNIDDIRKHNDYCADVCSAAPDRLLGFCTLNPTPISRMATSTARSIS